MVLKCRSDAPASYGLKRVLSHQAPPFWTKGCAGRSPEPQSGSDTVDAPLAASPTSSRPRAPHSGPRGPRKKGVAKRHRSDYTMWPKVCIFSLPHWPFSTCHHHSGVPATAVRSMPSSKLPAWSQRRSNRTIQGSRIARAQEAAVALLARRRRLRRKHDTAMAVAAWRSSYRRMALPWADTKRAG
jgi:hypothetical protein